MVGDKEPKALPFADAKLNDASIGVNNIKKLIFFIFILNRLLSTDILSVFTGGLQIPKGKDGICRYVKGNKTEL